LHICFSDEKRKRKTKRIYDALQKINEASDERDTVSLKSRESRDSGAQSTIPSGHAPAPIPVNESHHHPPSDHRSILKSNRHHQQQRSLPPHEQSHLLADDSGSNIDDNDPSGTYSQTYRVFEHSLRQLDQCRPYPQPPLSPYSPSRSDFSALPHRYFSISSAAGAPSPSTSRSGRPHVDLCLPARNRHHILADRGGYATDSEVGYVSARFTAVRMDDDSDEAMMVPPHPVQPRSPTNSLASTVTSSRLAKPHPPILRNIEMLLKQLEQHRPIVETANSEDTELSATEADHEQCSNTESNRGGQYNHLDSYDLKYPSNDSTPASTFPS
jgi:hypothetical protein